MNRFFILFFIFNTITIGFVSCTTDETNLTNGLSNALEDSIDTLQISTLENSNTITYSVETFKKAENDWGYRIMNGEKVYINQPHIPAMQGVKGFSSQKKALTTGNYILNKINDGLMFPTVTLNELDSLGVLN